MLDNNLKHELLKAYNNVSKTSKIEYNQQNLDDLIKLFHDNQYLSIMFKILSCFNQKITEGNIDYADYEVLKAVVEQLKSENQALKVKLDQQNKLISSYNGMYANRAKVASGIRKPARIDGIEPSTIRQYINAGYSILITNYDEPERMFSNDREHTKIRVIIKNIDRAVPEFKIWEKIYDQLIDQTIKAMVVKEFTVYKAGCHVDMSHQAYTDDECIGSCYTTSEELARKYVMSQIRKHSHDYDLEVSRDKLIDNIFCIPIMEHIG